MQVKNIPLELNRDAWEYHNMNYEQLTQAYNDLAKLFDDIILDDSNSNIEIKESRGQYKRLKDRLLAIESALQNLERREDDIEGLYTFNDGSSRVVKSHIPDEEKVPYIVDESLKG